MPRVDFYVLPASVSPEYFACAQAQLARAEGREIHIHAPSREDAGRLDELLWTFRDVSFIPHALVDADDARAEPVTIGWGERAPRGDVLINLAPDVPPFVESFAQVLEPVPNPAPQRQQARERFRRYRDMGLDPHSHDAGEQNGRA